MGFRKWELMSNSFNYWRCRSLSNKVSKFARTCQRIRLLVIQLPVCSVIYCCRCSGRELYGFSGWHCQTWSLLRARTCGLQPLRLLSFRAIVVSSHLLYATIRKYASMYKCNLYSRIEFSIKTIGERVVFFTALRLVCRTLVTLTAF